MLDEIMDTVLRYMSEKVKLTKGAVILLSAGSFILGIITGVCAAKLALSKKLCAGCSCGDDFDADEYVRNLNFDD